MSEELDYLEIDIKEHKMLLSKSSLDYFNKYKWRYGGRGYIVRSIGSKSKTIFLHRELMKANNKTLVDHINGNRLDNRIENLRFANRSQNSMNRGKHKKFTSKFKGVSIAKREKKWRAGIMLNGEQIHLGFFLKEEDAAAAYNEASIKYHGEYGRLNEL